MCSHQETHLTVKNIKKLSIKGQKSTYQIDCSHKQVDIAISASDDGEFKVSQEL